MHREYGETAVRGILGVLSLAKKHGAAAVDDTGAAALEVGSCEWAIWIPAGVIACKKIVDFSRTHI